MRSVSAVIPTCDRLPKLLRALKSVRRQTREADEIIVVDNGRAAVPPDSLPEGVILIRTAPRIGASAARNAGAERATGDYIAFLDDDDEWEAGYLEKIGRAIGAEGTPDLLIGRRDVLIDGEQRVYKCLRDPARLMPDILFRNPGAGGTNIVVRREAFDRVGGFDTELRGANDRAFVLELMLADARIACVPDAVTIIDRGDDPRITNTPVTLEGKRNFLRKYRHLMGTREWLENHSQIMQIRASSHPVLRRPAKWFARALRSVYPGPDDDEPTPMVVNADR